MHHGLVDLDAQRAGESVIAKASGFTPVVEDKLSCYGVELERGDAGLYPFRHLAERAAHQIAGRPHLLNLFRSLDEYHFLSLSSG